MSKEPFEEFETFIAYAEETDNLLYLSMRAISGLQGITRLTEVLSKSEFDEKRERYSPSDIEEARKLEDLAKSEIERGFPLIIAHSIVAIWSALEACIPEFCADWLIAQPELLESEGLAKIKVSATLLNTADRRGAMRAVVSEIERQVDAPQKAGLGRFQANLEKLGLGFGLDDDLRKSLFEMSKVRNLIVHRLGKADEIFANECPWRNLNSGDRLVLTLDDYKRYRSSSGEYAAQIIEALENIEQFANSTHLIR